MVLNLFEKSPEIGRLLVRLHDRNALYSMAQTPDDGVKSDLTQIIADLLSFDLKPAENELIADVLMSLLNQAEKNLRRAISEKLSVMSGIPLRIILKIANDEIFVADPVLKKSADLSDLDLMYVLKANGKEHWNAIASRPEISNKIIEMLADKNDLDTSVILTKNRSITLSDHVISKFYALSKTHDRIAEPLLSRDELPKELAIELYDYVGERLKQYIKDNFVEVAIHSDLIDNTIKNTIQNEREIYSPSKDAIIHSELLLKKDSLTPAHMIKSLRQGDIASFIAQFSVFCGLKPSIVEDMLNQKAGHSLAIVCKAMEINKSDFLNMFLLTTRVRGARIINESDLSRAMSYFTKIDHAMAKKLLNKYRH